eukprot:gene23107-biopygen19309
MCRRFPGAPALGRPQTRKAPWRCCAPNPGVTPSIQSIQFPITYRGNPPWAVPAGPTFYAVRPAILSVRACVAASGEGGGCTRASVCPPEMNPRPAAVPADPKRGGGGTGRSGGGDRGRGGERAHGMWVCPPTGRSRK